MLGLSRFGLGDSGTLSGEAGRAGAGDPAARVPNKSGEQPVVFPVFSRQTNDARSVWSAERETPNKGGESGRQAAVHERELFVERLVGTNIEATLAPTVAARGGIVVDDNVGIVHEATSLADELTP